MSDYIYPASLLCDFYKLSHRPQYPVGTEKVYSTWTPRSNKYFKYTDKVVTFGIQPFVKKYLISYFNEQFFNRKKEDVVAEYIRVLKFTMGIDSPDSSHIEALHDLGYLPIKIKALKEGTLAPIKTPMLTIENTHSDFFWLTNYLETLISNEIWLPMTSATIAYEYRKLLVKYAMKTVGNIEGVGFQAHDFSMRGMASLDASKASAAAHMTSHYGTDSVVGIMYLEEFYNANIEKELVGTSIPATEHSVMSANTDADNRDEFEMFKRLITEVYPSGFVSIVSDTYDFWKVIGEILPRLKDAIMARDGKVVIRPDSGDPAHIICGKYIENITKDEYTKSLEDAKQVMRDIVEERVREETPHGEYGESNPVGEFKFEGKYYRIELDIFWNRHDKQYYYIDNVNIKSFEEFTPSLSDLGLIESLWNIFGGTVTEQGYKVLDSHIGAIYGDSITIDRAKDILERLEEKGFASTNIVLGIGSFSYQYNTRDTFNFAMKATHAVVNGAERLLFKDPKTDDGTKRSQRGMVAVTKVDGELHYTDELDMHTYHTNFRLIDQLEVVFEDGELKRDQSLSEIRNILHSYEV